MKHLLIILTVHIFLMLGIIYPQVSHIDSLCDKVIKLKSSAFDIERHLMNYSKSYEKNIFEYEILTSFLNSCELIQSEMFHYESFISIVKYLNADEDRPIFNIINEARAEIHSMTKVKIESINDGISASKRRAVKDIGHKLKKLTQDFLTIIEKNPI